MPVDPEAIFHRIIAGEVDSITTAADIHVPDEQADEHSANVNSESMTSEMESSTSSSATLNASITPTITPAVMARRSMF